MKIEDIIKDKTWIKDITCGVVNETGLTNYLIRTVPVSEIAKYLAYYIFEDVRGNDEPIVISEETFKKHFRIKGFTNEYRIEGIRETRGRKENNIIK